MIIHLPNIDGISACGIDAPGPTSTRLDEVTCVECVRAVLESIRPLGFWVDPFEARIAQLEAAR